MAIDSTDARLQNGKPWYNAGALEGSEAVAAVEGRLRRREIGDVYFARSFLPAGLEPLNRMKPTGLRQRRGRRVATKVAGCR